MAARHRSCLAAHVSPCCTQSRHAVPSVRAGTGPHYSETPYTPHCGRSSNAAGMDRTSPSSALTGRTQRVRARRRWRPSSVVMSWAGTATDTSSTSSPRAGRAKGSSLVRMLLHMRRQSSTLDSECAVSEGTGSESSDDATDSTASTAALASSAFARRRSGRQSQRELLGDEGPDTHMHKRAEEVGACPKGGCGLLTLLAPLRVQLFAEFDRDGSGGIDFEEFGELMHALGLHLRCARPAAPSVVHARPRTLPAATPRCSSTSASATLMDQASLTWRSSR